MASNVGNCAEVNESKVSMLKLSLADPNDNDLLTKIKAIRESYNTAVANAIKEAAPSKFVHNYFKSKTLSNAASTV